jgi:hypothetical protein
MNQLIRFSRVLCLVLIPSAFVSAETITAQVFAKPESAKEVLYNLTVQATPDKVTLSYRSPSGSLLVEEYGELSGDEVKTHSVTQNQLKATALIERQGDKVVFKKTA